MGKVLARSTWPIIIGGCFRSGTSLVRRLLNAHSRIYCGPEVKFFRDFYGDYFHDPLHHLRFTRSARSMLPEEALFDILGRAFVTIHERAARRASKSRWGDKNPENVLYLNEWQRLLGEHWLFIHVVRNPLDTLASIKEKPFPLTIPAPLQARIGLYRRYLEAGMDFRALYPERYYGLIYEQLVSIPQETLESLMSWLGDRWEAKQISFNEIPHQHGLEDPKITSTTGIHADSVGRWQSVLSLEEAKTIWRESADLWTPFDPDHRYVFFQPFVEGSL